MQSTAPQLLVLRCAIFFEQPTVIEKQMENEMSPHSKTFHSVEDYLRIEETALRKSEYLNGEMTEMPGVTREHILIVTNLVYALRAQMIDRPFEVYCSELRLKVSATGLYTYPDVMVSEAEPAFEDAGARIFLNPILLIEVLSKATESNDRGWKFSHYQRLQSLREYVLVSQNEFRVEQYVRQPDGKWLYTETTDPNRDVIFEPIACRVQMKDIYHRVIFKKEEDSPA